MSAPFYVVAYYRVEGKDAAEALERFSGSIRRDVEYFEVVSDDGYVFDVGSDGDSMWIEENR